VVSTSELTGGSVLFMVALRLLRQLRPANFP